jgi:hypothetical protein
MKKALIITLFFFTCCSGPRHRADFYFELPVLEKIAKLATIEPPPSAITFAPVYIIGAGDSISQSSFEKLQSLYKIFYVDKYSNYSAFLLDALNQTIKINIESPRTRSYFSQTFLIDRDIGLLYKVAGIKGIMDKHCAKKDGLYILKKEGLTLNEINSVSYYFFIGQYLRSDDDYSTAISFMKLSSILK